ncbi:DUF3805 domain-containing protein [Dyadobacter sp. CY261]|uniref:DUF3805 domain-containing protein n=1 Tax=Dyadobacter sp. CY261 TaxID=2907203 RepID=UPI0038D4EF60
MDSTDFRSQNGRFSLTLPKDWFEYDDSEEDDDSMTYSFFNSSTEDWSGNLRITPYRWAISRDPTVNNAARHVQSVLKDSPDAVKIKLRQLLELAFYTEEDPECEEANAFYYWIGGVRDDLFVCSFVIDKKQKRTVLNSEQLDSYKVSSGALSSTNQGVVRRTPIFFN